MAWKLWNGRLEFHACDWNPPQREDQAARMRRRASLLNARSIESLLHSASFSAIHNRDIPDQAEESASHHLCLPTRRVIYTFS